MKYLIQICIASAILVSCLACNNDGSSQKHETENSNDKPFLIPGLSHGLMQSPINILSDETEPGKHSITVNFSGNIDKIKNLGHTIQLDFEPGNTINIDNKVFEFSQLHFHTPSEHLIDGMTYPMEMHVVNTLISQKEGDTPEYLVIAYLFKMGEEQPFIKDFIDLIPEAEGSKKVVNLSVLTNNNSVEKMMNEWRNYYYYKGSLTTPPYTESVNWCVLSRIFEASPEQIVRINELEGNNARRIQAVYDREIEVQ